MSNGEKLSIQQQISRSERLRRRDGAVTHVQVADGLWLPFGQFHERVFIEQEFLSDHYLPHINGGGLIAASSLAPDTLTVPHSSRVDPNTRVLRNLRQNTVYLGDTEDDERYTRFMTGDDEELRDIQLFESTIARVLKLEQHLAMRAMKLTS